MTRVVLADTVTLLDASHRGGVLVTGSHGGLIAAYLAARGGVRAAIFNDAGGGLDDAGFAGLAWLDGLGIAAATVAHTSARIADAADARASGVISHANAIAVRCGVSAGMRCADAADALRAAPAASRAADAAPPNAESRTVLRPARGGRRRHAGDRIARRAARRPAGERVTGRCSGGGLPRCRAWQRRRRRDPLARARRARASRRDGRLPQRPHR
jgi:hypothetical protein